jgi:hypothetical protein
MKNTNLGLLQKIIMIPVIALPFILYPIFIPHIVAFFVGIVNNIKSYFYILFYL